MSLDEETFCTMLIELMELEHSLPRPSFVMISSSMKRNQFRSSSKLELDPEFGTFSSVTEHHLVFFPTKLYQDTSSGHTVQFSYSFSGGGAI